MALTKIPDSLLKKFQCAACGRYLSMAPIGVRADGESICNRCTDWMAPQTVAYARCKVYEELAHLHLFPCSYRAQGCLEYVEFNKAFEHENKCVYRTYSCPVSIHSTCNWVGTVSQMSKHYKGQHPELHLKVPNFRINFEEDYEAYYLVEVEGIVLLLQIKVESRKSWFNAVYMGSDVDNPLTIKYSVKLSGEDSRRAMELEDRKPLPITHMEMITTESVEVDIEGLLALLNNPEFIQAHWFITVSEDLKNRINQRTGNELTGVKCSICKFSMVPPIYRCPLGHVICVDCKGYNESCEICHETDVEFSRAIDLENVAQSSSFLCRWARCRKIFYCDEIRAHEQECDKRVYKCPECNQYVGVFNKILKHYTDAHNSVPFDVPKCDSLNFAIKTLERYVFVHNEIFKVGVNKDPVNTWTVYITYYGPPGLDSYWKYEIKDCYNVLYYASKCSNNRYKATQRCICCKSSVRSENYLTIRFDKQKTSNVWVPFDHPPKRICKLKMC